MDSSEPSTNVLNGFQVDTISLEEMRQTLVEVHDYFQAKLTTLNSLKLDLDDTFKGGHEGETGAFKAAYEQFGTAWLAQYEKMLVLDQAFVNLINEQGEAVKSAITMYTEADDKARSAFDEILREIK